MKKTNKIKIPVEETFAPVQLPDEHLQLASRLQELMDYLKMDKHVQKGFLFYLGAALTDITAEDDVIVSRMGQNYLQHTDLKKLINHYHSVADDLNDFPELDSAFVGDCLYTAHKLLDGLFYPDAYVVTPDVERTPMYFMGNQRVVMEFFTAYYQPVMKGSDQTEGLPVMEGLFRFLGQHLESIDYDRATCYQAGYAWYSTNKTRPHTHEADRYHPVDLLMPVYRFMIPVYRALCAYPIMDYIDPLALQGTHIFSLSLEYCAIYQDDRFIELLDQYHQQLFYDGVNRQWNDRFKFDVAQAAKIAVNMFEAASQIRETDLYHMFRYPKEQKRPPALPSSESLDADQLGIKLEGLLPDRYRDLYGQPPRFGWLNNADVLQYAVFIFYFTCMEVMGGGEV